MSRRIIDLSMPCSNATDGFSVRLQDNLPVYFDRECYAYDLEISSHRGTYFETPAHVFRERMNTDQFPLEKLIVPGFCLRVAQTQRCITAADLDARRRGGPPAGICSARGRRRQARALLLTRCRRLDGAARRHPHGVERPTIRLRL